MGILGSDILTKKSQKEGSLRAGCQVRPKARDRTLGLKGCSRQCLKQDELCLLISFISSLDNTRADKDIIFTKHHLL